MKVLAGFLFVLGTAASLNAQPIERLRFDIGYGGTPMLKHLYDGFRGVHAIVVAESPWGEFGLHYVGRSMKGTPYSGAPIEMNASTIALQYGASWKSSRTQFAVSAGIGAFGAKVKYEYFYYIYPNPPVFVASTSTVSRIAFPADMRMCWNVSEHFGLGAAVFGAFVQDNSYVGFHGFVRVAF